MPVIAAIKYCKILVDIKVEPLIWWKCPFTKVKSIRDARDQEDNGATKNCFSDEDYVVRCVHSRAR